ncbi:hypothetical protein BX616_010885 [Lobosporangium transversale]|nr:hypothetical protein BX616_010885 [Lobosporangium transversale]
MSAIEDPHPQRNTPQYHKTQHHPHPPYEPLHPPHPQEDDCNGDAIPLSSITASGSKPLVSREKHSFTHSSYTNRIARDDGHYLPPPSHVSSESAPSDMDTAKLSSHSPSPRGSPGSSYYSENDPRSSGSTATPAWSSHSNMHTSTQPASQQYVHPYRSQSRMSPFDPSISSSSSSASPSPSISTATAVSTPLTTDAMLVVTNRAAATSICDPKWRGGSNYGSRGMREDHGDLGADRHSLIVDYVERMGRAHSDPAHPPHGGLIQPAPNNPLRVSPSYSRQSNPETSLNYKHHLHPSPLRHFEEPPARRSMNGSRSYGPEPHHHHHYDHNQAHDLNPHHYQNSINVSQRPVKFPDVEQGYRAQSPSSNTFSNQTENRVCVSSSPILPSKFNASHNQQHPSGHAYSPLPPTPPQTTADAPQEVSEGQRSMAHDWSKETYCEPSRYSDPRPVPFHHGQGQRHESMSPPSPLGVNTMPSSLNLSSSRQQPSVAPRSPRHLPHPTLQQQQHPPPLYDPVRESDHKTFEHPTAMQASVYSSNQNRQPDPEQSHPLGRQHFALTNSSPSGPSEEGPMPSRQPGPQPHGLAARAERNTSHPYYNPVHPDRSFASPSSDTDDHYSLTKDTNHSPSKTPLLSQPPSRNQPLGYPPSPQDRPSKGTGHDYANHIRGHVRPSSQGHQQVDAAGYSAEANSGHHRDWNDPNSGCSPREGAEMIEDDGKGRSSAQQSVSSSQWRGSRRSIRSSISEPDLQLVSSGLRQERHMTLYHEEGRHHEDNLEDLTEDDEEGSEEQEYDEKLKERQIIHRRAQTDVCPCDYDSGATPESDRRSHSSQPSPGHHHSHPHHYSHPQAHSYDGSPPLSTKQHPHEDYSAFLSHQHVSAHAQPYPPPLHHLANIRSQHPGHGQYYSQYQPHQQQHPIPDAPYQASGPGIAADRPLLPNMQVSSSIPSSTTTKRRGPYLSRSRAIMAGMEVTTASSRYQCQYCQKRFSRPSSLRIHTYSHTGERPFKCSEEGCGRQFSVQSNMRRHLRVHRMGRVVRSEFAPRAV